MVESDKDGFSNALKRTSREFVIRDELNELYEYDSQVTTLENELKVYDEVYAKARQTFTEQSDEWLVLRGFLDRRQSIQKKLRDLQSCYKVERMDAIRNISKLLDAN